MKSKAFEKLAPNVIKNLEKRNMEGYYFEDSKSCVEAIMKMIPDGSTVSWGGSMTMNETGMMDALKASELNLIDRMSAKTPQESREIFAKTVLADYYFMSTNAITNDGILINIDGNANRVACLMHGPEHVLIVAGMNKVVEDVDSGIQRVGIHAAPANAARLNTKTPCNALGHCGDCHSDDCMCCQVVITRHSRHKGRIKVILVGEELGF